MLSVHLALHDWTWPHHDHSHVPSASHLHLLPLSHRKLKEVEEHVSSAVYFYILTVPVGVSAATEACGPIRVHINSQSSICKYLCNLWKHQWDSVAGSVLWPHCCSNTCTASILAILTRHVAYKDFKDTKKVSIFIFSGSFIFAICIPLIFVLDNLLVTYLLNSLLALAIVILCLSLIVAPKIVPVAMNKVFKYGLVRT